MDKIYDRLLRGKKLQMLHGNKSNIIYIITNLTLGIKQLWVIISHIRISLQMPQPSFVYIRPSFQTRIHSFFRDSERRPVTRHQSSTLRRHCIALPV